MSPMEKFLLFVAAPAVLVLSLVEAVVLSRLARGAGSGTRFAPYAPYAPYDWRGLGVSLFDFFLRIATTVFVPLSLVTPIVIWLSQHRLEPIALDGWAAGLGLFIGLEFCYYWLHRAAHRVRWFWANHAVHHSPNQLNLAASLRIGAFGRITGNTLFVLPLYVLGFELRTIAAALTLNLLYQFWLHATWIPRLGWLEWVLNTPSAHRVHHAANPEYLDANYGGVLIIFDRLFGTYIAERDDVPCRYGWVDPMLSNNPLRVEFSQWLWLARDISRARSVKALAGTLLMPPGWRFGAPGHTTEEIRRNAGLSTRVVNGRIERENGPRWPSKEL